MAQRRRGFTLVELLVVVAIIAILMSLLVPALAGARENAKTVKCAAQLKGMSVAVYAYTQDWDNNVPSYRQLTMDTYHNNAAANNGWLPYVGISGINDYTAKGVVRCPTAASVVGLPASSANPADTTTFAENNGCPESPTHWYTQDLVTLAYTVPPVFEKVNRAVMPGQTGFMFCSGNYRNSGSTYFFQNNVSGLFYPPFLPHGGKTLATNPVGPGQYMPDGFENVMYFDFHVEKLGCDTTGLHDDGVIPSQRPGLGLRTPWNRFWNGTNSKN